MMTATAAELPLHGPWPSVEKCLQFVRVSSESWLSLCLGSINRDLSVDFWRTKGFKWSFTDFFFSSKEFILLPALLVFVGLVTFAWLDR